ncbi:sn-glycerol-3-phosphate ABC transporter permease UgpE [Legionella israelensis]|nr:sn-glycerol-3-phosphate ABC transporter permease UgpE [Legionella israelensis]
MSLIKKSVPVNISAVLATTSRFSVRRCSYAALQCSKIKVLGLKLTKCLQTLIPHIFLSLFVIMLFLPLYLALVAASHEGSALMHTPLPLWPGTEFFKNMKTVLTSGLAVTGGEPILNMLWNSLIMALLIAGGKIILALCSAFALVYFDFPFKKYCFALIFSTMMLPVEVRIVPTFQVIASFGWLNSYSGLTLPLMASATATFLFRQFFKTVPSELVDAAKLDGAGPLRFFWDILLPLSRTQMAALFVILFVYGWNQYLWPLVITTEPDMATIVMGIRYVAGVADQVPQWHYIMTMAIIALVPPCMVVMLMQYWFEKGLK